MPEPLKVVAILAGSPALSSILNAVLAARTGLRVRSFESQAALTAYMRLSATDLLVCDFDCEASPADKLARALHDNVGLARRDFQVIALTGAVNPNMKVIAAENGIDEIIVKPMSPRYLLERVEARLKLSRRPQLRVVRTESPRVIYRNNVVPLFPNGHPHQPRV